MVDHILVTVVERQADGGASLSRIERGHGLADTDDAVARGGEMLHLLTKSRRSDGELVPLGRHAMVSEDPYAGGVGASAGARLPPGRARMRVRGLCRVQHPWLDGQPGA